jgi:hypothetical protein
LIVIFVGVGVLLALAEMGTNVLNELKNRQANLGTPLAQPTATPTLTPEEMQKILRNKGRVN